MSNKKSILSKVLDKIKHGIFLCRIVFYTFGLILPVLSIIRETGFLPIHISLICTSALMIAFNIIYRDADDDENKKSKIKSGINTVKTVRKWLKRLSRLYIILTLAYTVYYTSVDFDIFSLIVLIFMIIVFSADILFSILFWYLKKKIIEIKDAAVEKYDLLKSMVMPTKNED